jgi:hypothetical protein
MGWLVLFLLFVAPTIMMGEVSYTKGVYLTILWPGTWLIGFVAGVIVFVAILATPRIKI